MSINDLGDGIKGELCSRDAEDFWKDESNGSQHGSTAVLQLGFTEPREPLGGALIIEWNIVVDSTWDIDCCVCVCVCNVTGTWFGGQEIR